MATKNVKKDLARSYKTPYMNGKLDHMLNIITLVSTDQDLGTAIWIYVRSAKNICRYNYGLV